jgi:predicted unusual protein kinase regulating ubiquinone biosynthesis (AarF/ABC1/UbiB family)
MRRTEVSAPAPAPATPGTVLTELPREKAITVDAAARLAPAMMTEVVFAVGWFQVLRRLFAWLYGGARYALGVAVDRLLRRDSPERRAVRLRETFELLGGTFIKVGQQLSMRVDLLPVVYCDELAKLLDKVPPFPARAAIRRLEAITRRPLSETFAAFDPDPIGSASIACVFQGVLRTGERVAVKVRRPDIGRLFTADLKAFELLTWILEFTTVVRQDFFRAFRFDLRTMLMEELDFTREGRSTDVFRRTARKKKQGFLLAPRVFFDLSSEDVLVTEFVTGVWLSQLLGAVESSDEAALAQIRAMDIDPKVVGNRLVRASLFGQHDCLVFHADPHPANIVVQPGNKLMFIDFGSSGAYSERDRGVTWQLQYHMGRDEVSSMVRAALALNEPLPPVDADELSRKLEVAWWRMVLSMKSKHVAWWERTTAGLWLFIMKIMREYHIPMTLNTLKIIRATLIYDTIAARLNPKVNVRTQVQRYTDDRRARLDRRALRQFRRDARGLDARRVVQRGYVALEETRDLVARVRFRMERLLNQADFNFASEVKKASFVSLEILRLGTLGVGITAVGAAAAAIRRALARQPLDAFAILKEVAASPVYWVLVGLLVLRMIRHIQFRVGDRDPRE